MAERNLARHAELVALIRRKLTSSMENFYDMGEALREIADKKLYAAAGHASLAAMLKAEGLMSETQASKLLAVARRVSRAHALALGHERAYALLSYVRATTEEGSVTGLVESTAKIAGRPVMEASLRDIVKATREARAEASVGKPRTGAQRERRRIEQALIRAVRESMHKAGVGRPTVAVVGNEVRVVFSLAQAERLTR